MGQSASSGIEPFDFEAQLLKDTTHQYSVEVDDQKPADDCTPPRRHPASVNGLQERGVLEGVDTLWDAFQLGVKNFKDGPMLGTRTWEYGDEKQQGTPATTAAGDTAAKQPVASTKKRGEYRWQNYAQVDQWARNLGKALQSLEIPAESNIGIFSINRAEWIIAALGNYSSKYRTVALYDTLGDAAVEYIVNHAELPLIYCSKDSLPKVLKSLDKFQNLKFIVQFDVNPQFGNAHEVVDAEDVGTAKAKGIRLLGLSELIKIGEDSSSIDIHPPTREDLAIIMYTSGTTGMPKGVMLQHKNVIAAAGGIPGLKVQEGDSYVSYLPLAHIFETSVQAFLWSAGVKIGFYQGDPKKVIDDFCDIKPACIAGVPRVFQRMYQKIFEAVNEKNCLVKTVFAKAYNEQSASIRSGNGRIARWDAKIFTSLKEKIGMGKTRYVVTGGAPCPAFLIDFLRIVTGAEILQGYGLTETSASATIVTMGDLTIGHCGAPFLWSEVRLKSVPDMGYNVNNEEKTPKGEVQVRGAGVFKGYYKNEEATKACFDGEWFATGDIGRFNPNGTLSIIDRKKNIFKLAHGEYIAVEKVEAVYARCTILSQLWVYGNSFKTMLVGVLIPDANVIYRLANEKSWWKTESKPGSPDFLKDFVAMWEEHKPKWEELITGELKKLERELKGFEKVSKWLFDVSGLDPSNNFLGFTVENECMTPTFKLKRNKLLEKYVSEIKEMYTQLGEPPQAEERW